MNPGPGTAEAPAVAAGLEDVQFGCDRRGAER